MTAKPAFHGWKHFAAAFATATVLSLAWLVACGRSAESKGKSGRDETVAGGESKRIARDYGERVFEAAKFQDLTNGRFEPQYNWVILFTESSAFTLPVKEAGSGDYEMSIDALNGSPGPVILEVSDATEPKTSGSILATFTFAKDDNSMGTVTKRIRLREGIERLRVRFANDSPVGAPFDRNAAVQRVVLRGPMAE